MTALSADETGRGGEEQLVPLAREGAPGIYYVTLQGPLDTITIPRDRYDADIRDGDDLYLAPQAGEVLVLRDGATVARIPIAASGGVSTG